MNIQPISTCTQNCRILRTTFSVADALHWYTSSNSSCYHVIWYLFWCETPPSSSGKWRSSSGLLMGYPKGFASQDSYVTKLHRYTKNYPFMMLVSSKSTHVVSVRHSPAGNPGSPGRLKKRSSKPLESWIKDDSNRFNHYTSYKPLSSIHSQQPNFPLNLWGFRFRFRIMKSCPAPQYFPLKYIGMTWHDNLVDLNSLTWCGEELDLPNWSPKSPHSMSNWDEWIQWKHQFINWIKGSGVQPGNFQQIPQLAVYTSYIPLTYCLLDPFGGLYAT